MSIMARLRLFGRRRFRCDKCRDGEDNRQSDKRAGNRRKKRRKRDMFRIKQNFFFDTVRADIRNRSETDNIPQQRSEEQR